MDFLSASLVEYDEFSSYPLNDSLRLTHLSMVSYMFPDKGSPDLPQPDFPWVAENLPETLASGLGGVTSPLELKEFVDDAASSTQAASIFAFRTSVPRPAGFGSFCGK